MPKQYNIKWRDSDTKKLANAVRSYNAKRTRLLKQVPELDEFLPPKASTKEIRAGVKTRRDLENEIKSLKRFLEKGAEKPIVTKKGVKTTAYEKKELTIKINAINARRRAELEKAAPSTEKGTMRTIRENNLLPKRKDLENIPKRDWAKFVESVEKQAKDSYSYDKMQRYKENLLKGLNNVFGEKGRTLIDLASKIPAETLVEMYYNDPVLQIDFIYDPLEMEVIIETMEEHLNKYLDSIK